MPVETSVRSVATASAWSPYTINPEWILEGSPVARMEFLSGSVDGTANTYFWDCTAGRFNWFYSFDETLLILEGSVSLKDPSGWIKTVAAGDVIFFPAGVRAEWTVTTYVRKLAFCRTPLPASLVVARNAARRLKRALGRGAPAQGMFPSG